MSVATVSTVRALPDDIRLLVRYYINLGVQLIILFFDDPRDSMIAELKYNSSVMCFACDDAHWARSGLSPDSSIEERQRYNADVGLAIAKSMHIRWILHLDADELVFTGGDTIDEYLDSVGEHADVVCFPTYEAVPELNYRGHVFEEIKFFKTENSFIKGSRTLARIMGCRRAFENGYLKAHSAGKSAVRVEIEGLRMGIHAPTSEQKSLRILKCKDAYLLHYDCCTFDDWMNKWKRRYDHTRIALEMREERREQFARFIEAFESGTVSKLRSTYRNQYFLTGFQKRILLSLGLLRRIEIGKNAFAPTRVASGQ